MVQDQKISQWEKDVFFGVPSFDDETLNYCKESGDWMPVAFEWHKHAAKLLLRFAQLGGDTDAGLLERPNRHHAVMRGLLVRSAKIMFAGAKLVAEVSNGDMLIALERMAMESMVKCRWLIKKDSPELFDRFIKSGLKKNDQIRTEIYKVNESFGGECQINARLQENLDAAYTISGVTESDVLNGKGLPNYKQMLESLELDHHYLYFQSIPSSQIHGDWSDLIANHLEYDYELERFNLKSSHNEPKARVCFVGVSFAFETLKDYISYNVDEAGADGFINLVNITKEEFEKEYLYPVLEQDFSVD